MATSVEYLTQQLHKESKRMTLKYSFVIYPIAIVVSVAAEPAATTVPDKSNIVYILCDDLGYGDVKCLGGERSKIPTPNMDRLVAEGMSFTEAHASEAKFWKPQVIVLSENNSVGNEHGL